jgi:hypothetical protein
MSTITKGKGKIKRIITIEDFFYDDPNLPWKPLPKHALVQSPCYPIIGKRNYYYYNSNIKEETGEFRNIVRYYCKVHPNIESIDLEPIEHHCKYKEPDKHKAAILQFLQQLLQRHQQPKLKNKMCQ